MRLTPSDPDLNSLVARIVAGEIDLQPDFQRGEVWSVAKRQRLIDSILRDWHIPPIHIVIEKDSAKQLVLDGQQRLVSIRDFVADRFAVDGDIAPVDERISRLKGLYYSELPVDVRRRFDLFSVRVFRITDYEASEPGELFYRLNQTSILTSAEQRNAFFGNARRQVKELVGFMAEIGLNEKFWGFANARMAYDDILARVLLILDNSSLRVKVTAASLTDKYRSGDSYSEESINRLRDSLLFLSVALSENRSVPNFNKATSQTWLVFISTAMRELGDGFNENLLASFMADFSALKIGRRGSADYGVWVQHPMLTNSARAAFSVYEDRATSRVLDVSSVVLRDLALWSIFAGFIKYKGLNSLWSPRLSFARDAFKVLSWEDGEDSMEVRPYVSEGWDL